MAALAGRRPRAADFEPATLSLGLLGRSIGAVAHVGALNRLQGVARRLAPFFARFDILLTLTLAAPPARTGLLQPSARELRQMRGRQRIARRLAAQGAGRG